MAPWFTIGLLSIFLVAGVWASSKIVTDVSQSLRAGSWPTTRGKILSSGVLEHRPSRKRAPSYTAVVEYSYRIKGKDYRGGLIAFGYDGSSHRKPHKEIADALRKGGSVNVRYNPDEPGVAVLSHGIHNSLKGSIVFCVMWFGAVLGFILMALIAFYSDSTLLQNISRPIEAG